MKLLIHNLTRGHFEMNVEESNTIKDVKNKIRRQFNLPIIQQALLFKDDKLEDESKTLFDYGIEAGSSLLLRVIGDIKISVEFLNDLVIYLEVKGDDTVENLKQIIEDKTDNPADRQHLYFNGIKLDSNKTVAELEIKNGSALLVRDQMQIKIKTPDGRIIYLNAHKYDSIGYIKNEIHKSENFQFKQQLLFFNGKEIKEGKDRLNDYGIENDSTIDLLLIPNYVPSNDEIQIYVETLTGKKLPFNLKMGTHWKS